jgi:hypothetical protein
MSRHLTPEEISLNKQELTCRDEIEQLEMQEANLEYGVGTRYPCLSQNVGRAYSTSSVQSIIDKTSRVSAHQGCSDHFFTEDVESVWRGLRLTGQSPQTLNHLALGALLLPSTYYDHNCGVYCLKEKVDGI